MTEVVSTEVKIILELSKKAVLFNAIRVTPIKYSDTSSEEQVIVSSIRWTHHVKEVHERVSTINDRSVGGFE